MFDVQADKVRVMVVKLFAGQLDVEQSVVILPPNREGTLTSFFKVVVFARVEDRPFWRGSASVGMTFHFHRNRFPCNSFLELISLYLRWHSQEAG